MGLKGFVNAVRFIKNNDCRDAFVCAVLSSDPSSPYLNDDGESAGYSS